MEKAKKEFKEFIVKSLKDLPRSEKKRVIDEFMDVFRDALKEVGIGVMVKHVKPDIPEDLKQFIDFIRDKSSFNPEEFLNNITQEEYQENTDIKKVGDSVAVIGKYVGAYMHDYDTKEQLSKEFKMPKETFTESPAIVVEVDTDFTFNCGHCDEEHHSDLVIYMPSKDKKYHISSRFLKLI